MADVAIASAESGSMMVGKPSGGFLMILIGDTGNGGSVRVFGLRGFVGSAALETFPTLMLRVGPRRNHLTLKTILVT